MNRAFIRTGTTLAAAGAEELNRLFAVCHGHAHLALAVSGGADSMALMHLARRWQQATAPRITLTVLTVDHGLRPQSAAEARQVAAWARHLRLDHVTLKWPGKKPRTAIQETARAARYGLLTGWCRAHDASALLLAHHMDDQAETVLMRLSRGSGLAGLAAMKPVTIRDGVTVLRPLLGVRKSELEALLRQNDQGWISDPSNDNTGFARIRMRQVLAALEKNSQLTPRLARLARGIGAARDRQTAEVAAAARTFTRLHPGGYCEMEPQLLAALPATLRRELLGRALQAVGGGPYPPNRQALDRLVRQTGHAGATGASLHRCLIVPWRKKLWIIRELRGGGPPPCRLEQDRAMVWDHRFEVRGPAHWQVAALGKRDWHAIRERLPARLRTAAPAAAWQSLPALRHDGRLQAVPHLEFSRNDAAAAGITVRYLPLATWHHYHFNAAY
ncbi:MAG TPA: tRNA lysidine(34) synthetase TilS [Rhodobacteraceae bacterium]|nr:tRNA lysidine(34) synthetase TilS [Paracoccaceae bacterium]